MFDKVDICFAIDTTGSMGGFINYAKGHMKDILSKFDKAGIDLKCGLVEYRDHPPQDGTFVTRMHRFGAGANKTSLGTYDQASLAIGKLNVDGGGDSPEAVYDGVWQATKIAWRNDCFVRLVILIGDAPPQGYREFPEETVSRYGAAWTGKTPSGIGIHECTAAVEEVGARLCAVCLNGCQDTEREFARIAHMTGGELYSASGLAGIGKIVDEVLQMAVDLEKVHKLVGKDENPDVAAVAESTGFPISKVCRLVSMLRELPA